MIGFLQRVPTTRRRFIYRRVGRKHLRNTGRLINARHVRRRFRSAFLYNFKFMCDESGAKEQHVYTVKSASVDQYELSRPKESDHAPTRLFCCVNAFCIAGRWRGIPRSSQLLKSYKTNASTYRYYIPSSRGSMECFTKDGYWILRFLALIKPRTHSDGQNVDLRGFVDEGTLPENEYREIVRMVNGVRRIGNERSDPYGNLD